MRVLSPVKLPLVLQRLAVRGRVPTSRCKKKKFFGDYSILTESFGLAPSGGIHMQSVKGKPQETRYATRPGARSKRREVALG
jgi:hypothetical protein